MARGEKEYEVAQCLGMSAEELVRCDSLEVAVEGLSPHLKTLLVQLVEGGETWDGQIGREITQLDRGVRHLW